jgi:hypothetical protein
MFYGNFCGLHRQWECQMKQLLPFGYMAKLGRVGHLNRHKARPLNFAWLKPRITSPRIYPAGWHPMLL